MFSFDIARETIQWLNFLWKICFSNCNWVGFFLFPVLLITIYQWNSVITINFSVPNPTTNQPRLLHTDLAGPKLFIITKFDFTLLEFLTKKISYLEVGWACRKNDPVSPDELTLRAECDVDEGLLLEERVEDGEEGRAMVVPLQAELLVTRHLNSNNNGVVSPIHKILRSETIIFEEERKSQLKFFFQEKKQFWGHKKKEEG